MPETKEMFSDDVYLDLVEPLFSLPVKLSSSQAVEYLPIVFVLFKFLKPKVFLDAGSVIGNNLFAAVAAKKTYDFDTDIYACSRSAESEDGMALGTEVAPEIYDYISSNPDELNLVHDVAHRADALCHIKSVDLLFIDIVALSAYEADDVIGCLAGSMSASGVIVITGVNDDSCEAGRKWSAIKSLYSVVEFKSGSGLGIVMLGDGCEPSVRLQAAFSDSEFVRFYGKLVCLIGGILPERVGYFSAAEMHAWKDKMINVIFKSRESSLFRVANKMKKVWTGIQSGLR